MAESSPIIGRVAPSPTGPLHLGSLVAAVGSYLMARHAGGKWLLRIEDLDIPRVIPGVADDILRTLDTLGLHWDGEVLFQSSRTDVYQVAMNRLVQDGLAYSCGCTRAEIARISSAPHGEEGFVYAGTCRDGLAEGKTERAFRVKVYDDLIEFDDAVLGRYSQQLSASCGDFVVQRADGPFAYHLAVVVDDAECGVNQVVRGRDLLSSTPRQIYLQKVLGYPTPSYAHLPLVTNPDGSKLSKRDNPVSLSGGLDLLTKGGPLLLAALGFLGQTLPRTMARAGCEEILEAAVAAFDLALVPNGSAPLNIPGVD
jgi:glutamyl-Q tRNA(Asp) synthetase